MKVFLLSTLLWVITLSSNGQIPTFEWAKGIGGKKHDFSNAIASDASGNVYLAGNFNDKVDFDPGEKVFELTANKGKSIPSSTDIFIAKYDSKGHLIWAKSIGGPYNDGANAMCVDASENIYITGYFCQRADFDPGKKVSELNAGGGNDVFVLKLDSDGNFIWAKNVGGNGGAFSAEYGNTSIPDEMGKSIVVDSVGNCYVSGAFFTDHRKPLSDFDPGGETYILEGKGSFVLKLDEEGEFLWAQAINNVKVDLHSLALDGNTNVYITGTFGGPHEVTLSFDTDKGEQTLTSNGWTDVVILKFDSQGEFVWVKSIGGKDSENGGSISVSENGEAYVMGSFVGKVDFDPGIETYFLSAALSGGFVSLYPGDFFVLKLNSNGNFLWARHLSSSSSNGGFVRIDKNENLYILGHFKGTLDIDPEESVNNVVSKGNYDLFLLKMNKSGNLVWSKTFGGSSMEYMMSGCLNESGKIYATGMFKKQTDLDPTERDCILKSVGKWDIFMLNVGEN